MALKRKDANFKFDPLFKLRLKKASKTTGIPMVKICERGISLYLKILSKTFPELNDGITETEFDAIRE